MFMCVVPGSQIHTPPVRTIAAKPQVHRAVRCRPSLKGGVILIPPLVPTQTRQQEPAKQFAYNLAAPARLCYLSRHATQSWSNGGLPP